MVSEKYYKKYMEQKERARKFYAWIKRSKEVQKIVGGWGENERRKYNNNIRF